MTFFTNQILKWYYKNKRDLPWRKTSDPYKIWVSEIILQQTRIDQGTDYYLDFIRTFPDVLSLARAPVEKVLKSWQGLGYYSRARNLHEAAKEIAVKYKGIVPDTYKDLISLKGIGDYTAGAILSIAFNKAYPVVDGNVIRVISRIFGITKPIGDMSAAKEIRSIAEKMMPDNKPGDYNQALMEFGALHCKPQNPLCIDCPMQSICYAYKKKLVEKIPAKKPDAKIKKRHLNYLLIKYSLKKDTFIYLRKRMHDDIWKNLYDLPCIETKRKTSIKKIKESSEWKKIFGGYTIRDISKPSEQIHKLSHQTLFAAFYEIKLTRSLHKAPTYIEVKTSQLHKFPIPRLIEKYLTSQKLLK